MLYQMVIALSLTIILATTQLLQQFSTKHR